MSDQPPSDLHQLATIAWQIWSQADKEQRRKSAAEQERRRERFRTALQTIIGEEFDISISVNGGCIEATVDDLRFIAFELAASGAEKPETVVTLLGRCPSCGVETMSEPFYNLAGLGKMLEKFEPLFHHICLLRRRGVRATK
jgi:hypothetical protein